MSRNIRTAWRWYGVIAIFSIMLGVCLPTQSHALPVGASLVEENGLLWLSPIWSLGIAYSEMQIYLSDPNSAYYGLEVATTYQVTDLLNNYSIYRVIEPGEYFDLWGPTGGLMNPFFDLFGWTETQDPYRRSLGGYVWDPSEMDLLVTSVDEYDIYDGMYNADYYEVSFWTRSSSGEEGPTYGTWLIKTDPSPVPEPSSFLLFGASLAGLAGYAWRKRQI